MLAVVGWLELRAEDMGEARADALNSTDLSQGLLGVKSAHIGTCEMDIGESELEEEEEELGTPVRAPVREEKHQVLLVIRGDLELSRGIECVVKL